ncbi:MAG TPA: ATP-binding protein [Alphaproteobacteria bacterium]|nr:ATP-binding protein [Alphaproteobacteria bacterium]
MKQLYSRWQRSTIEQAMATRRVVLLVGARQCGKTTLAKQLISEDITYLTLDEITLREAAENDPQSFVNHKSRTLIIDEIQRVPSLLPAIKKVVDEDTQPGQYLLTGSANIQALPSTQESLAGRISKIRLRPLSQGEIKGSAPDFLEYAFKKSFNFNWDFFEKDTLIDMAFRGGFPEALTLEGRNRKKWHRDYIEALLERDLKDVAKIHKYDAMHELIKVLAAWSSKFMDVSSISSGLFVHRPTAATYINALEALYIVERLLPWTKTDYDRVGKHSKLFMSDSGLMSSILSWNMDQVRFDPDRLGKLMETFIFNELASQIDASEGEYELYHYRDREQREIDFLIEREDQAILGIEVKSSASAQKKDFKHLQWFQENLAKDRPFIGIVLYSGNLPLSFGLNLWAIPISMLWPSSSNAS